LMPILQKLKFEHTVDSSKAFSEWFRERKFDKNEVEIFSLDFEKLFPSIPNQELIELLLEDLCVKNNAHQMLPRFRNENGRLLPVIPRHILKIIFQKCFSYFTAFEVKNKFFRQLEGLSMGESFSPILANFFLSKMEEKIVKDMKSEGKLVDYKRYADDVILIIKKGHQEQVAERFLNIHEKLKFTIELPQDGSLKFLDFQIYQNDSSQFFELKSGPKQSVPIHMNKGIAPKELKKGLIISDFIRSNMKNSTDVELKKDHNIIKKKYIAAG